MIFETYISVQFRGYGRCHIKMPTIELKIPRLEKLVGKKLDIEQLQYDLQWISLDVDDINREENSIKVEYNPNRPDFASPEGIARQLQGYYGIKTGLATF